ncbi:hypothetical protein VC83_08754 [Pseudogymnoascus destructans]|uniref:Uncharacterized protein n=2 Tax=Pseudogymnoascus destructans TaxID=655981 RepID=L8G380_PSED2|nr:uncharacterized protein VC83_08754 [Pseudogymnoascus destructans]ELR06446.1 hypothetical protein GMDG_07971 [Pseudogymnoascus destructans 20631-21]OAF55018.1 hypothetical protein VC83_08754 [Pseudogymnoascus destructans]
MISRVVYRRLWAMVLIASSAAGGVITSPAVLPRATTTGSALIDYLHECDGKHIFWCPQASGTCYTGIDGYIGCCSTTSCAARTTCIPYDSEGSQKCDPNSGGCWSCSDSNLPACVTVTNVVAKQHIFYCSFTEAIYTSSYENLVTIGSMAFPPSGATMTTGSKTAQISSSTMGPVSPTATVPTSILSSQSRSGLSAGSIAGIVIGVICVLAIIAIIAYLRYCHYCKRRDQVQHVIDASCGPRNGNMSQKQPVHPSPINDGPDTPQPTYTDPESPGYVARSVANDPEDYFSPIEVIKRVNTAEALAKLENRDKGLFEMGADTEHSVDRTIGRAEIGFGSGDAAAGIWKTIAAQSGNPSAEWRNRYGPTELEPSSTREGEGVLSIQKGSPPSRQPWRATDPADEELVQHNQRAFSANSIGTGVADANGISPALTSTTFDASTVVSPLLSSGTFSTTALMGLNPKPSVGELNPRATVEGPLNWPILAVNRNSSKLTSATGWESKYLSPEMAVSNGFSAGEEVAEGANMTPENRDSGPSDAASIMPSRASR